VVVVVVVSRPQVVVVAQNRSPFAQTRHPAQVLVVAQNRHPAQAVVVAQTLPLAVNRLADRLAGRLVASVASVVSVVSLVISFVLPFYILRGICAISVGSGDLLVPSAAALVSDTFGIL